MVLWFQFTFKKSEKCKLVCNKKYNTNLPTDKTYMDFLKKGMLLNYQHHWYARTHTHTQACTHTHTHRHAHTQARTHPPNRFSEHSVDLSTIIYFLGLV